MSLFATNPLGLKKQRTPFSSIREPSISDNRLPVFVDICELHWCDIFFSNGCLRYFYFLCDCSDYCSCAYGYRILCLSTAGSVSRPRVSIFRYRYCNTIAAQFWSSTFLSRSSKHILLCFYKAYSRQRSKNSTYDSGRTKPPLVLFVLCLPLRL